MLELYQRCQREEAAALLGIQGVGRVLCDGDWMIFSDAALCFAIVEKEPKHSDFATASRFCWVTDKPHQASKDPDFPFLPAEVRGERGPKRPISLFVRRRDWSDYLYVGTLGPSHAWGGSKTGPWHANFDLSPALPSRVWFMLRGETPESADPSAVDRALVQLQSPTTADARFSILQTLVEYWHGPIGPEDGLAEETLALFPMPALLRRWYRWAGRRSDILSGQNFLLVPERIEIEDERLLFYVENQWCYAWATLPEGDDPPVFGRVDNAGPWQAEGVALSEHLIHACLFEAMFHAPYSADAAWLDEGTLKKIVTIIPQLAVPPWRWNGPTQFYAKGGAFMVSMANGDIDGKNGYSVWIGAKTQEPLLFLKPYLDEGWENVAV
jgi:hypothetical protein